MYRTIFFFTNSCEPELAHRLQTSKMRGNSTSFDSCQHDDINIVTVSVARRRWTAPLKPRRSYVKHFTTFYALLKHVSPKGDYFTPKGHFFAPWGHYFAHRCENRPFSLSVNGAQTRVLHACVKKKKIPSNIENLVIEAIKQYQKVGVCWQNIFSGRVGSGNSNFFRSSTRKFRVSESVRVLEYFRVPECLRLLEPRRVLERLRIFERLRGWGSKFGTTKCRTIYISKFQNCEY